jgi:hypothetical protein
MALAVGLPGNSPLPCHQRQAPAPSPSRNSASACVPRRLPGRTPLQTRHLPHAQAHFRHPPPRGRLRHPDHPRALGPPRRSHNDDLHPRPQPGPLRRAQPPRLAACSHYQAQQHPPLAAIITIPRSTTLGISGHSPTPLPIGLAPALQAKYKLGGPEWERTSRIILTLLVTSTSRTAAARLARCPTPKRLGYSLGTTKSTVTLASNLQLPMNSDKCSAPLHVRTWVASVIVDETRRWWLLSLRFTKSTSAITPRAASRSTWREFGLPLHCSRLT